MVLYLITIIVILIAGYLIYRGCKEQQKTEQIKYLSTVEGIKPEDIERILNTKLKEIW